MLLKESFSDFISNISLDDTRKGRIKSAHNTVRDYLESHSEISGRDPQTFLQGSYKLHTAVKPQNEGSFDVDVVVLMNLDDFRADGKDVMDWLKSILAEDSDYKDRLEPNKKHCVRLDYATEFHMDITPAHPKDAEEKGVILVPNDWIDSHPHGLKEYCVQKQKDSDGYFYKVVKLLKWWRNIRWGDEGFPKSIVLTTLVSEYMKNDADSLDEAFFRTIQQIDAALAAHDSVPKITNPALETEDISASWSQDDYDLFKTELSKAVKSAKKAFDSDDEEETIDLWNSDDLFKNTFPKTYRSLAEETKNLRKLMDSEKLFVETSGVLTAVSNNNIKVYPTKFYGENLH